MKHKRRIPDRGRHNSNKNSRGKWFVKFVKLFLVIAILVLLTMFALLPVVVAALDDVAPPQFESATVLLDKEGEEFYHDYEEYRIYVSIDEMPSELVDGIIALEDRRFSEHLGIDVRGIGRAMWRNIRARDIVEGGSTITQQLAKNYFLDHSRTLDRKVRELFLTLHLERTLSKQEIIEQYLNGIYFGHGAHGVEAASRMYFGKNVTQLTLDEIALLVGIPRSPYNYSPYQSVENAESRRNTVLQIMADENVISQQQAEEAAKNPVDVVGYTSPKDKAPYFANEVIRRLEMVLPEQYLENGIHGGLTVHTTIDLDMQEEARKVLDEELEVMRTVERGDNELRQPQGAVVAIEPDRGKVKAFVSGRDYEETQFNRANPSTPNRSVGSTLKPFVYAAGLAAGEIHPATTTKCEETIYPREPGWESGPFIPTDYGGGYHDEKLTIRRAIRESCNVTAVKIHDELGRDLGVEKAVEMGLPKDTHNILSFPLGQIEITPINLAESYIPFANEGIAVEPALIEKVTDSDGNVIYERDPVKSVVLSEQVAFQMTDMLSDVISPGGTASTISNEITFPAAGKTGTTQDGKDAVFVGYTPELVTVVTVGDDNNIASLPGTGGSLAAPLWSTFMNAIIGDLETPEFSRPPGLIEEHTCQTSGQIATESCPSNQLVLEYFQPGNAPEQLCEYHYDEDELEFPPSWWPLLESDEKVN